MEDSSVSVSGVSLDRETLTLGVNQELTLTAAISPAQAANKAVTWTSSDTSIATVGADGKVTGVAVGTAIITVTTVDGGHTDTCEVTVQQKAVDIPVTGVSLNPKSLTFGVGASEILIAAVTPPEAANKTVTWASDKPGVAAVAANGRVSGVAPGTAVITVTTADGGHKDTCAVTVQQEAGPIPVPGVSLSPKTLFLAAGTTGALTATPPQAVTWVSSDANVAAVDENGVVTGVAPGTATITVTTADSIHTDTCAVAVNRFTITNTGEWNSAIEAVKNGGDNQSYTFVINGTVNIPGTWGNTFGGGTDVSVTVQGSGELALTSPGGIFTLEAGQTLILGETGGSGPTLRGIDGNDMSPVYVGHGEFTMNGGTIYSNSSSGSGGGVYVFCGAFTMTGGSIRSNYSEREGGGVYVEEDGTFTKSGGNIRSNRIVFEDENQVCYYTGSLSKYKYRNGDLGEGDDISTTDLETNWDN